MHRRGPKLARLQLFLIDPFRHTDGELIKPPSSFWTVCLVEDLNEHMFGAMLTFHNSFASILMNPRGVSTHILLRKKVMPTHILRDASEADPPLTVSETAGEESWKGSLKSNPEGSPTRSVRYRSRGTAASFLLPFSKADCGNPVSSRKMSTSWNLKASKDFLYSFYK